MVSGKEAVSEAAGHVPGIRNLADGIPGHLPGSFNNSLFLFLHFWRTMKNYLLFLFTLMLLYHWSAKAQQELKTPGEAARYSQLTTNKQLVDFLKLCDLQSEQISVNFYPLSESRMFPEVIFHSNDTTTDKLTVLFLAQQHGNEPSGMEGLSLLIRDLANGLHKDIVADLNLIILPQCNPYGNDFNQRRTAKSIDMNRDHLLMRAEETTIIQQIFDNYRPQFTVDFHEYYPFGNGWKEFGYRRNFDIQLGGLTNINTNQAIRDIIKSEILPWIENGLVKRGYTFFEYTLGDFPSGERLRHSTIDVNDGRQSFGIAGTLSLIVEGMNGRDSLERLQKRSQSQYETALLLLKYASGNAARINQMSAKAREKLNNPVDSVSIRQDHFRGDDVLNYPLLSLKTLRDTIFIVEAYHPVIKSLLGVYPPKGYLIPVADTLLINWLKRSNFEFSSEIPEGGEFIAYRMGVINSSLLEGIEGADPQVFRETVVGVKPGSYFYVPVTGIYSHKIIIALEPQSMYGIASYPEFDYLLRQEKFPVLRVE